MVWGMCGVFYFALNWIPVLTIINFSVPEKKIINVSGQTWSFPSFMLGNLVLPHW